MATAGPKYCGTAADDAGVGTIAWADPTEAQGAENSGPATATLPIALDASHYLKCTNFGFTSGDIPADATVNGILFEAYCEDLVGAGVYDGPVRSVQGGTIGGTNLGVFESYWPFGGSAWKGWGGATQLWGRTWLATDIHAATFGVAIAATCDGGDGSPSAAIDAVRATIYYTAAAGGSGLAGGEARVFSGGLGVFRAPRPRPTQIIRPELWLPGKQGPRGRGAKGRREAA